MDYTRTLLIITYMAIGAFRDFLSVLSSLFLQQETQLCKIPKYVSMIYFFISSSSRRSSSSSSSSSSNSSSSSISNTNMQAF